ncbi:hypothetical protein Tco_1475478 [Tanacetum coccineum]
MENEHELSYETLTRVYLGSYEHYKGVVVEVEYLEPGFELQGAKMVEMGHDPRIIWNKECLLNWVIDKRVGDENEVKVSSSIYTSLRSGVKEAHDSDVRHWKGVPVRLVFLLGLLALAMAAVCASRAAVKSAISCRMASKVMTGVLDVDVLLGGIICSKNDITSLEREVTVVDMLLGTDVPVEKIDRNARNLMVHDMEIMTEAT